MRTGKRASGLGRCEELCDPIRAHKRGRVFLATYQNTCGGGGGWHPKGESNRGEGVPKKAEGWTFVDRFKSLDRNRNEKTSKQKS